MNRVIICILSFTMLFSCQKNNKIEEVNFFPSTIKFMATGGVEDILISATSTWEIKDCPDWIHISKQNGIEGISNVRITAQPNPSKINRNATLSVFCNGVNDILKITQEGASLDFNVEDKVMNFDFLEHYIEIKPKTNIPYEITHCEDWMIITDLRDLSYIFDHDYSVTIQPNPTDSPRSGVIIIGGTESSIFDTLYVNQSEFQQFIKIQKFSMGKNSVGGCSASIEYSNVSDKTFKYVYFSVYFQNNVGDAVKCTITGDTYKRLQYVGPIEPGKNGSGYWSNLIYNYSATKILLASCSIEFMDGTKTTYSSNLVDRLF